nr:type VI secretion system tube protein Hcp [Paraburkholderia caballeronis]
MFQIMELHCCLRSLFRALAPTGTPFNQPKDKISMPIPAYMWLKDDGGADIKGSSTVQGREGSIEIISFGHGVNLPVDAANGKITGARTHSVAAFDSRTRGTSAGEGE